MIQGHVEEEEENNYNDDDNDDDDWSTINSDASDVVKIK